MKLTLENQRQEENKVQSGNQEQAFENLRSIVEALEECESKTEILHLVRKDEDAAKLIEGQSDSQAVQTLKTALEKLKKSANKIPKLTQQLINKSSVNKNLVKQAKQKFNKKVETISHELSLKPGFYKNSNDRILRKLANKEILEASDVLYFDFSKVNIVPLFDITDNNYLGYSYQKDKFCIINITDEISSDYFDSMIEVVESLK